MALFSGTWEDPGVTFFGGSAPAAGVAFAPAIGFGPSHTTGSDAMTVNFGATAYVNTAPSGFGSWPGSPAQLDAATLLNVTLSGLNLKGTSSSVSDGGARNVSYQSTGLYYVEFTLNPIVAGSQDCCGFITAVGSYNDLILAALNSSTTNVNLGTIFSNNTNSGKTLGPLVSGDVIGAAINLTTRRLWFRRNAGNWNGDASANPATGVGGVTVAS